LWHGDGDGEVGAIGMVIRSGETRSESRWPKFVVSVLQLTEFRWAQLLVAVLLVAALVFKFKYVWKNANEGMLYGLYERVDCGAKGDEWVLGHYDAYLSKWEYLSDESRACVHFLLGVERIPLALVRSFSDNDRKLLCGSYEDRMAHDLNETVWSPHYASSFVFAHPQFGLGNRMRALGSLLAFAQGSRRTMAVLWTPDEHLNAGFNELFSHKLPIPHIDPFYEATGRHPWCLPSYDINCQCLSELNFMLAENSKRVHPEKFMWAMAEREASQLGMRHFYAKTAYTLKSNYSGIVGDYRGDATSYFIRKMVPSDHVWRVIRSVVQKLPVRLDTMVGMHIRASSPEMEFKAAEHRNVSDTDLDALRNSQRALYGNHGYDMLAKWREKTGVLTFVDQLKQYDPDQHFFVASDTEHTFDVLWTEFPGRVHRTPGTSSCGQPRDTACVQLALVDMIMLSRTKELLGSGYSSYSEVIRRIANKGIRLAGKDF